MVLGSQILCLLSSYSSWTAALNTHCWPSDWHQHHPRLMGPSIFPCVRLYLITHLPNGSVTPNSQASSARISTIVISQTALSLSTQPFECSTQPLFRWGYDTSSEARHASFPQKPRKSTGSSGSGGGSYWIRKGASGAAGQEPPKGPRF